MIYVITSFSLRSALITSLPFFLSPEHVAGPQENGKCLYFVVSVQIWITTKEWHHCIFISKTHIWYRRANFAIRILLAWKKKKDTWQRVKYFLFHIGSNFFLIVKLKTRFNRKTGLLYMFVPVSINGPLCVTYVTKVVQPVTIIYDFNQSVTGSLSRH